MAVTDAVRESMSAVMDGEGTELDLARVLKEVEENPEARAYWARLQRNRGALRTGQAEPNIDVSSAVREALEAPAAGSRRVGPLGSLAVAASVTFAVVFGGQSLLGPASAPAVANSVVTNVPGGVVPVAGGAPVQARFGINNPTGFREQRPEVGMVSESTADIYNQLARERFQRYSGEHARSTARLQPNLFVPFSRAPDELETQ